MITKIDENAEIDKIDENIELFFIISSNICYQKKKKQILLEWNNIFNLKKKT